MDGEEPLGYSDATGALAELADLDQLDDLLAQDYPGASLDDIDEELIERALGRPAVDDLEQLRRIERELQRQGYLERGGSGLTLTPRALRRLGATALRRVFALLDSRGRGWHDVRDAGAAGEVTGASREWRFGDEQPLDVVRTVRNAVLRTTAHGIEPRPRSGGFRGRRDRTAFVGRRSPCSSTCRTRWSCAARGARRRRPRSHCMRWSRTKYPQDAIQIIGFSDYARVMSTRELVEHDWDRVQGTNLQHGLMLARRHLDGHRNSEPVILVITDGEPTAHLAPDGFADFAWPPTARDDRGHPRRGRAVHAARAPRSTCSCSTTTLGSSRSCRNSAAATAGGSSCPSAGALGEYVVADYLRARRGRRRREAG